MLIKKLLSIRDEMLGRCTRDEITALWSTWFAGKGVQETYDWFRPRGERRFWAKCDWKDFVPPKYSFITWLALARRLSTRDRLNYLENLDATCQICSREGESVDHLFFKCSKTWAVWGKIMFWLGTARRSTTIRSVIKWVGRQIRGSQIVQMEKRIALMASVAIIWRTQARLFFYGKAWDAAKVIFEFKEANYNILYSHFPHEQVLLHLPDR